MTGGGPLVDRNQARQLARRELARSMYQPSLLSRWWHDLTHWLSGRGGELSWWSVLALAIVVVAAIAITVALLGSARTSRRLPGRPVLGERPRRAEDYRAAAERLAAAADYGAAIVERVRAIAATLENRRVLPPGPARTATELADAAGRAFPAAAADLKSAAHLFDEVRYGGRPGTEQGYALVRDLDNTLLAATAAARQTAAAAAPPLGPVNAGPPR
jgi:hypothetical protein